MERLGRCPLGCRGNPLCGNTRSEVELTSPTRPFPTVAPRRETAQLWRRRGARGRGGLCGFGQRAAIGAGQPAELPVWCLDRVPPRGALVSWRGAAWEVSHSHLRVALVITQGLCHWNSRRTKTSLGSPTVSGFWVS